MTIANLTDDPAEYGTRIGMGYTIASIGALVGNPIAGATLAGWNRESPSVEMAQASFRGIWIFSGACMFTSFVLMMVVRYKVVGTKIRNI
jgi:MFS family permease